MTFDPFFSQVIDPLDIEKVEKRTRVFSKMLERDKVVPKYTWDEIKFIKLLGQGGFCSVTKVKITESCGGQKQHDESSHERRWNRRRAKDRGTSITEMRTSPTTQSSLSPRQDDDDENDDKKKATEAKGTTTTSNVVGGRGEKERIYALKSLNLVTIEQDDFVNAATDLLCEAALLSNLKHENIISFRGMAKMTSAKPSTTAVTTASMKDGDDNAAAVAAPDKESDKDGSYQYEDGRGFFFLMDVLDETLRSRFENWRKMEKRSQRQQQRTRIAQLSPFKFGRKSITTTSLSPAPRQSPIPPTSSPSGMTIGNNNNNGCGPPSIVQRLQTVALGIAKGMEYLHSENIVMRDLKPDNVGFRVDENSNGNDIVTIFDFGLARPVHKVKDVAGSWNYCAPEYILNKQCSLACDVFSYSLVLYELVTLLVPFEQMKNRKKAMKEDIYLNDERPSLDKIDDVLPTISSSVSCSSSACDEKDGNYNDSIKKLIQDCWDSDPKKRPTFSRIIQRLEDIISDIESTSSSWTERESEVPIAVVTSSQTPDSIGKTTVSTASTSTSKPTPGSSSSSLSPVRAAKDFFLSRRRTNKKHKDDPVIAPPPFSVASDDDVDE